MSKSSKISSELSGEEVLAGNPKEEGNGRETPNPWDSDFSNVNFSDIDRILNIPGIDDMAGVFARANFKNDDDRIAYLMTDYNLKKLGLDSRREFLRVCIASTLGNKAFGKTLQLQAKTALIAPALMREQLSLSKLKEKEDKIQKSDFRDENKKSDMDR
jgi:hypothetical protein